MHSWISPDLTAFWVSIYTFVDGYSEVWLTCIIEYVPPATLPHPTNLPQNESAYVNICQHMSTYDSIRQTFMWKSDAPSTHNPTPNAMCTSSPLTKTPTWSFWVRLHNSRRRAHTSLTKSRTFYHLWHEPSQPTAKMLHLEFQTQIYIHGWYPSRRSTHTSIFFFEVNIWNLKIASRFRMEWVVIQVNWEFTTRSSCLSL